MVEFIVISMSSFTKKKCVSATKVMTQCSAVKITESSRVLLCFVMKLTRCSLCRMEETVRSLLQNQGILEQTAVNTVDIMKAYKVNWRRSQ